MACCETCHKPDCHGGCQGKPVTQYIGDLPIDNLDSVADYFLAERDVEDPQTGTIVRSFVRVPGGKLFPNANMDNIIALETNNLAMEVPENQVRAVYISNEANSFIMKYADASHPAVMLALGTLAGMMLVQNTGFVNIPAGHNYIVGVQYYVGENGEPVTDASITGQRLFIPVSATKLALNIAFGVTISNDPSFN